MGLLNVPGLGPAKPGFSRILTFALEGNAKVNAPKFGHTESPVPAMRVTASAATIREGRILYDTFCYSCHGIGVVASALPDLRYASAATHARFDAIVLAGERRLLGMPSFGDLLTAPQARAIQAYVLSRAAESAARKQQ